MTFVLAIILALLTKPFFNSRLCKGDYGFAKTYFGFGFVGVVLISIAVFWILGPLFFTQDHGSGGRALVFTFRVWTMILAFYMAGIGLALLKIRQKVHSSLVNLYLIILLLCIAFFLCFAIYAAWLYLAIYGVAVFVLYKFYWGETFLQKQSSQPND